MLNWTILKMITGGLVVLICGCSLGPQALETSRVQYNEAMRMTRDEQLLLNLVRLRYRDAPSFLEVSSIASQFVIDQSASVSATINEGGTRDNPDDLGLGAGLSYSERPTISYSPLSGDKFVGQMLSPLNLETLILLTGSGWSADRVFRLTIQGLNGIENARTASGPTPDNAPAFAEFAEMSHQIRQLQNDGLISVGLEPRQVTLSDPLPVDAITAGDMLEAAKEGFGFEGNGQDGYVLTKTSQIPIMRIAPTAINSPQVRALVETMRLEPGKLQYDIILADRSLGGPEGTYRMIELAPRSLLGTMFYLAHAIEVPQIHRQMGLVTITRDAGGNEFDWAQVVGDLLHIETSLIRPVHPAVMVRYQGYYYYIDAADLNSKTTFALLVQLFELQAGRETAVSPVLTIPIAG